MPGWSTDEILAVHVRMHKAEGELFRDVLVAGARACGLALTTLADKSALEDAARMLGRSRARLDTLLATLGTRPGRHGAKTRRKPPPLLSWRSKKTPPGSGVSMIR